MSRVLCAPSRELGRSEARLELTAQAESTTWEERERLAQLLEEERAERRRLQEELENPEYRNLDVINLPSREWISIEFGGSFHVSVQQEQILAFSVIGGAEFRGCFPDGREFRRDFRTLHGL